MMRTEMLFHDSFTLYFCKPYRALELPPSGCFLDAVLDVIINAGVCHHDVSRAVKPMDLPASPTCLSFWSAAYVSTGVISSPRWHTHTLNNPAVVPESPRTALWLCLYFHWPQWVGTRGRYDQFIPEWSGCSKLMD